MSEQPLLTHDQLVDWLIYHVPLEDGVYNKKPFIFRYVSKQYSSHIFVSNETPWDCYNEAASIISRYALLHQEITDLYWYWTI